MAPIDDLPADQRAVLRLLLEQRRSYDEIAGALRIAPAGVRRRAHAALAELGPPGLEGSVCAELADWLLGQQDAERAARARDALGSSAAAREWARAVSGELRPLSALPLPEVPGEVPGEVSGEVSGEVPGESAGGGASDAGAAGSTRGEPGSAGQAGGGVPGATPLGADESAAGGLAARTPGRRVSRRGGRALLAGAGLLAALAVGFVLGRATDGGGQPAPKAAAQGEQAATVLGQATLTPSAKAPAKDALGLAQFAERSGRRLINVVAEGLPAAPQGSGYGVWLTGNGRDPLWLGYFQAATTSGQVAAQSEIPVDPGLYGRVIITRERGSEPAAPGRAYLSGAIQLR